MSDAVDENEVDATVELYFATEDPAERDVVFDRLRALRHATVDAFLLAMMQRDEDETMQAAAAAELARRGDPEGVAWLEAQLREPLELYFFTHAVQVLTELRGASFYDALLAIWREPGREPSQRKEAMVGLEFANTSRALTDFVAFVDAVADPARMPDAELAYAIAAFVRHTHAPGVACLQGLQDRLAAASVMDPDDRQEAQDFVGGGLDLLQRSLADHARE